MRRAGFLLLLLLSACAPVTTMMPARPAEGAGGTVALSVLYNQGTGEPVALPYLGLFWGDGEKEFGLVGQLGTSAYAKFRLEEGFSVRASVGLPGPWYEGALLYDAGPVTLAGRIAYARVEWGEQVRYLWLGGGSLTYWYRGFGFEAAALLGEGGWIPTFSVGYRVELGPIR